MFASAWNTFDGLIVLTSRIGSIGLLAGVSDSGAGSGVSDIFEITRAFRVLRIISIWPLTRRLLNTLASVLSLMGHVTAVYGALLFGFAVVGQAAFAGVSPDPSALPGSENPAKGSLASPGGLCAYCNAYWYGTLPYALLASVQMTVGNNWNSIMYPNLQGMGSRWWAIYFVAYRFIMMDVLSAIIESLMLDAYERKETAAEAAALQGALAQDVAKRVLAGGGTENEALRAHNAKFYLRARSELLEEISAVETAAAAARRGGGTVTQGESLLIQGLSAEDLAFLESSLRTLESTLDAMPAR